MKTFSEFQEGVASLAIKGGSKLIPALVTGIGAAGTIMQTKKSSPKGPFADTPSAEELRKAKLTGKLIKPKEGEVTKQKDLVSKAEKQITKPKKGEKKEALKTLKNFKKARKIEGRTMMRIKQDNEIATKGPGDQVPGARRDYLKKLFKNLYKEEVAIANSMGGGNIAGSAPAGDDPPVNKKKKKGDPTIIARGCMPGARNRFKGGVELLASLKKNKYT